MKGSTSAKAAIRENPNYRWYALGAVMLGTLMAPLDASIANVALPTIGRAFHTPVDSTEWVLISYMLTTASTLVLFGRLGDLIGQKRVYTAGFAIFGLASAGCAFAPSFLVLVLARAVQGIGSAMLMSSSPAIITNAFPDKERGRAIGLNGAAVAVGLSLGPLLGGAIVTYADWRWIFLINVPIAIAALAISAFVLKREQRKSEGFDFAGAALAFSGLFAVSLALSRAHAWGWTSARTIGAIAYALCAIPAFLWLERRIKTPMLDLELFKNRTFAFSVLAGTVFFCAMYCVVFTVPLAAQTALGRTGFQAGLLLLPVSALNVVLAPAAGAISDRVPARYVSSAGALVMVAGALLLAFLPAHPTTFALVAALAVTGAGTAVFNQPNNSTIMGSAPAQRRGIAAGMLATARTSGQLLGVCVAGAIYFLREQQLRSQPHSFAPATTVFFAVAALMIVVTFLSYTRES
ncbi:MAG TPA: MFS transporter [Candidatus Baltobacteraceae bacterium]|nr:MFS transporter [Candidatus Baltobacteraceae bacterium]